MAWYPRAAAFCLVLGLGFPVGSARAQEVESVGVVGVGVVVETLPVGSALGKAGVHPGDVLRSWERLPSPPENSASAAGILSSPFDWERMVTEQSMRGTVQFSGERQGRALRFTVPPGLMRNTEVRPLLPPAILEPYERGLDLLRQKQVREAVDCWRFLAEGLRRTGDRQRAGWLDLRIARTLTDLSLWSEAESSFEVALAEAGDPGSKVSILLGMGDLYLRQGRFVEAEESYLADLRLGESTWGESLETAESLFYLGWVAHREGRSETGLEYFEQARALRQRLAPKSWDVARSLAYLGMIAHDRGDLQSAAEEYRDSLELFQTLAPESTAVTSGLVNLGEVYLLRGDEDQAEELFRQALQNEKSNGTESRSLAFILDALGDIARGRLDIPNADKLALQSLHIAEKLRPDSLDVVPALESLGDQAMVRGDLRAAEKYFQRSLAIVERLNPESMDRALLLTFLGTVDAKRGEVGPAEGHFRQSLALSERLAPTGKLRAETLYLLTQVLRRNGSNAEAERALTQALEILEAQVDQLGGSTETKGQFRATDGEIYRAAVRLKVELGEKAEAFRLLERSRAQAFLALLGERDLTFSTDIPPALDRLRRRLTALYDGNELRLAELDPEKGGDAIETLRREQVRLREQRGEIDAEIQRDAPRLTAMIHPQTLTFEEVRASLDPGTVMLSYSVGEEETQLFVVTPGKTLAVQRLPIGADALRREVTHLRQLVDQVRSRSGLDAEGLDWVSRHLYRVLIAPAEPWIAAGHRILIVPDGPLHLLPFAALIRKSAREKKAGRGWQYLVEWKPLHTALSGTVYAELRTRRRETPGAVKPLEWVAFGDPWFPPRLAAGRPAETKEARLRSFSTRSGLHWERLPESRREVEQIAELYPPAARRVYVDREATEERAKALGREARIVHFATHGFVDDRSPFDSGLVLAIPDRFLAGRDNGLLQVWEIFESLRLDADLVVLSACETGLGEIRGGEGIIGLTRAFQFAGARSVLASLWRVDDRATAELMVSFYRHLRAGQRKDEALRAAQLELLARPGRKKGAAAAPYFWASMQLFGDGQ
jgi:CHAT domain-containing protein/tetratricopeptide (TPR) repeat protein